MVETLRWLATARAAANVMNESLPVPPLRGVIFDMDGTLTAPAIDFAEMRRRLGIPAGDILVTINAWSEADRLAAYAIIEEIEEKARRELVLQPGLHELMALLDERAIRKAIVTRNTARTVAHLLRHMNTTFSEIVTREFEPFKPHPEPALHICRQWRIAPACVLMVGDYRDDLLCGRAAGTRTCLLRNERNGDFASLADHVVADLYELRGLISRLSAPE